jgi:NitT/TauT family transport system permease protein
MPVTPKKSTHNPWRALGNSRLAIALLTITVTLLIWEAMILIFRLPPFILPNPWQVAVRFVLAIQDGTLLRNSAYTLLEILAGLGIGVALATLVGYFISKSRLFERLSTPFLIASQAVPVVAIAPLLMIWFGPGLLSKVLICALIVFFPVLVNTVVGLKAVPETLRDLLHTLRASRWQTLRVLEIPAALPVFLGGLRIGATLSVIGAVVGEFVKADRGLGFLINASRGLYDIPLSYAAVFALVIIALVLYGLVILLENILLKWQKET